MPLNFLDDFLTDFNNKADERNRQLIYEKNPYNKNLSPTPQKLVPLNNSNSKKSLSSKGRLSSNVKKKDNSFLNDMLNIGKASLESAIHLKSPMQANIDIAKDYVKKGQAPTDATKEISRGITRAANTFGLGSIKEAAKRKNDSYYKNQVFNEREGGAKAADFAYDALGYLAPGSKLYGALNASKLGKGLTEFGAGNLGKRLLAEATKGGLIGGGMAGAEVGARELINPDDYSFKDNAKHIALGTALGTVADPLLYGAGKGIAKGFESTANRTMRNLLPKNEAVASELSNAYKSYNAGPNTKPNPILLDDLIPKGSDITNPSFLPSLKPKTSVDNPLVPRVGKSIDELPPLDETSLLDRSLMFDGAERKLPDFSTARPVIEPPSNVNVYGVEVPKGDLVETAPPEYWQKRYEDFVKYVKENGYNENNLNNESINELWSHFAKTDEPALHTVVDLAYNGYKQPKTIDAAEVWDKMGNRPPVSQNAKKILLGEVKQKQKPVPPSQELLPNLKPKNAVQEPLSPLLPPKNNSAVETPLRPVEQTVNKVETPVRNLQPVPKQPNERSFYNTVGSSEKLSPEMEQLLNDFDKTYKPMSNEQLVNYANKYVTKDMEKAYQFVKNARKFDPRHITVGHRLIDELQKAGQYDRALDVVERLAEQGTKAGQSIQSYSIYNRLSAEGQLLRAQRRVNKINETITDPNKQIKLTEQNIQDITHTADSIQRFTGQQEQANNVIKIMENIKKGNVATDAELDTVRSFVSDAKKFVADLEPGAPPKQPKPIKDVRNRDKVVDFMDKREQLARKRLREIMGRANSMPVDALYALADIGASKIAKGTVKVADFTEDLVKEFGEKVRPYAKQIYNKAVETFNLQSESMTRQRLSEVEKITNKALKDKNISADEAESIREFARQVGQMSGDAKLEHSMELQTTLMNLDRPTFGQKISSTQTIAQLLNPKTIVRNAIGNEMFYRVEQMNKLLATPVDILRSKITGGERTITFRTNNQGQYWQNWLTGAKAGWKGVNPMGLQTAYDLGPQAFRSKFNPLTYLEKSLGATLRSFDHAGYMRAYNKTLGEMATLRAVNQGLKGQAKKDAIQQYIREVDENMMQIADQYGKYATFQDNTVLSNALTKVKKGLNKVSTLGTTDEFGLGDLVLKYPKTPGNLVMRALEYSPAGLVRAGHLLKSAYKTKNPFERRETALAFTRAIMGTGGFSLLGYFLADKGILTAAGNSDFEVAALEKMAGKQPSSVNISALNRFVQSGFNPKSTDAQEGDTFISYDWAQPISIAVALGTGVAQSAKENGKLGLDTGIKGGVDSAANTIINQSVLKGLNDFLANYPGRTMSDRVGDAIKGSVGSFVPTLSNQFRQLNNNTTRSTYSPKFMNEVGNKALNRIPGLDSKLPPAYDTLGSQKETYQGGTNNLLNVFLNPSFVSKYKPSPEAKFVLDYINATGDKTAAPRLAEKKLDGEPLTSQQYADMQRIMGQYVLNELKVAVPAIGKNSNDYERIKKAMDKILTDAGKAGREEIRRQRGE
ncbi:hypothetical protein QNH20_18295 [Neobacillus sp. WH10]|uniref:hypothetical protein n=1 Tax=Neobacillus sp. WH10 TaxID=3047873 RepID=UPI0024C1DE1F|nr:hypothetical protein [Neobacillus sp. WH10]WHY76063.1 hypothetical protein QNH20_18295 [Neobacillus sp. WH10]